MTTVPIPASKEEGDRRRNGNEDGFPVFTTTTGAAIFGPFGRGASGRPTGSGSIITAMTRTSGARIAAQEESSRDPLSLPLIRYLNSEKDINRISRVPSEGTPRRGMETTRVISFLITNHAHLRVRLDVPLHGHIRPGGRHENRTAKAILDVPRKILRGDTRVGARKTHPTERRRARVGASRRRNGEECGGDRRREGSLQRFTSVANIRA